MNPVINEIQKAIAILSVKINADIEGNEAVRLSQAALNLAHAAMVLAQTARTVEEATN